MGASDQPKARQAAGVPQELVCTVISASPDAIQGMMDHLSENGFSLDRVKNAWDTWRGTTFSPPDDAAPWSLDEYEQLKLLLEQHPNTVVVDETPGSGSGG